MQNLNIALIQTKLYWELPKANLSMLENKLNSIEDNVDLIVLPEMFSTGFTMNPKSIAHKMEGSTVNWLLNKAEEKLTNIVGSIIIQEGKEYYNRLIWAKPKGHFEFYDKKHLFSYAGEDKVYSSGNKRIIVKCCGWKICPFICYDLRFPLWNRNFNSKYDVALFIANWPSSRSYSWKKLIIARAIENQCYVVGVNRVGIDGNGIEYIGDSLVVNPLGNIISFASLEETIIKSSLSYDFLKKTRYNFPFLADADSKLVSYEFI